MKGLLQFILQIIKQWKLFLLKIQGKTIADEQYQKVASGKAWDEFCDSLKAAGGSILYGNPPKDPQTQAEAYRYLSRLTRAGLEAFVESNDPEFPILKRMVHETVKLGADNPDNYYQNTQISSQFEYKITGKRNSIFYIGFFTQNGSYGTSGGLSPCGSIESNDLKLNPDGSFEIFISKSPKGQNWLRIEDATSLLIVRQTFMDKSAEVPAELSIEALNRNPLPKPYSVQQLSEGLETAALFVSGASLLFAKWAHEFQQHTNKLPQMDPAKSNAAGGDKNIAYYHSYWKIEKDEVLQIKVTPPQCRYWNFQLNNHWMESLDYQYHNIHVNAHSAKLEEDGSVVVYVSHENKNFKNWISTTGHTQGTMLWRWWHASVFPEPECTLMKIQDLKAEFVC